MDSNQFFAKYDELILETIHHYHVPGVSIAVVDGDSTWVKVRFVLHSLHQLALLDQLQC
jgi:hypothetical protein